MKPNVSIGVRHAAGALALLVAAVAAYSGVLANGFVNFDDDLYVTGNARVQEGISASGIRWAFVTGHAANWHPVTWLSHMLDCSLFGTNPAGHHAVSLLLHAVNGVLLFLLLSRLTGAPGTSLFVAAVFAVHPVHVESVAWVAERKDVLSAAFGLAATLAYCEYTRHRRRRYWVATATCYALSLMAKPMLVTLPLLLLLLDWWPLERFEKPFCRGQAAGLCLEKAPLLAMAFVLSAITVAVQRAGGAVGSLDQFPLPERFANACTAYVAYLGKIFWPTRLAIFYPHPENGVSFATAAACFVLLALVTVLAYRLRFASPALLAGWVWFLLLLSPVIGILQFGEQAYADRYLYLAMAGPVLAAARTVSAGLVPATPGGAGTNSTLRRLARLSVLIPLALIPVTRAQVRHWRDSETLWRHAVAVTQDNYLAHLKLGNALDAKGRVDEAEVEFRQAFTIDARKPDALNNLGRLLLMQGRRDEAEQLFRQALTVAPADASAHVNLGILCAQTGRLSEAMEHLRGAIEGDPNNAEAHFNLATALFLQNRYAEAETHFREAFRINPLDTAAEFGLGVCLVRQGRNPEAAGCFRDVLAREPNHADARRYLDALDSE